MRCTRTHSDANGRVPPQYIQQRSTRAEVHEGHIVVWVRGQAAKRLNENACKALCSLAAYPDNNVPLMNLGAGRALLGCTAAAPGPFASE